jgi:hypothetical protein
MCGWQAMLAVVEPGALHGIFCAGVMATRRSLGAHATGFLVRLHNELPDALQRQAPEKRRGLVLPLLLALSVIPRFL